MPESKPTASGMSAQPTVSVHRAFLSTSRLSEKDASQHQVQMVILSSEQIRRLIALAHSYEIQGFLRFDHRLAMDYQAGENGKISAKDKRIERLAKNIRMSTRSIVDFATRLEQQPPGPQGLRLPSDELPTSWRQDFATARRTALSHISRLAPALYESIKTKAGLQGAAQNCNDYPSAIVDSIQLLTDLESLRSMLNACLPSSRQRSQAPSASLVTLNPDEVQAVRNLRIDKVIETIQKEMPEIPMDDGIILTEEFARSLYRSPGGKTLERHLIPKLQDAQTYLLAAREAIVQSVLEENHHLVSEIVTTVHGGSTITASDLGKTFVAGYWGTSAYDRKVQQYLYNGEHYDERHTKVGRALAAPHYNSQQQKLMTCLDIDIVIAQLTQTLDTVNSRLDRLQMTQNQNIGR